MLLSSYFLMGWCEILGNSRKAFVRIQKEGWKPPNRSSYQSDFKCTDSTLFVMAGSHRSAPQAGFVVSWHKRIKPLDPRAFLPCFMWWHFHEPSSWTTFLVNEHGYWNLHNDCKGSGISDVRLSIFFSWCRGWSFHWVLFWHLFAVKREVNWVGRRHHKALREKCF